MGYIIGPDGKLIDDGKAIGAEPSYLTSDQMTPEMIDQVLGYKSEGEYVKPPTPGFAVTDNPGWGGMAQAAFEMAPAIGPDGQTIEKAEAEGRSGSRGGKVKYSESGPNGVVPGNTKPYEYTPGTGKQEYDAARQGLGETVAMGDQALQIREQAGKDNLDIERRQYEEQGLLAATQQAELKGGEVELADRRKRRLEAGMKAQQDGRARIEAWNKEAEAAANTEVDPNRYWNDRSNFSKISFALGALAGGLAGKTGADNDSLSMLQTAIGRDINAQNDKMDRKMSFLKDKRGNIDVLNNLDRLDIADMDAEQVGWLKEFDVKLRATDKEIDKIVAKYGAERVNPKILELKAQVLEGRATMYSQLYNTDLAGAQKKLDKEFDAEQSAKTRAHQSAMQKRARSWEIEDREAEAKAALAKAERTGQLDTELLGGFSVSESGAKVGFVQMHPDSSPGDRSDFIKETMGLQQEYVALKALEQAFTGKDWHEMVRNSKGQSAALAKAISTRYAVAGKQVSDKEIDIQIQSLLGGSGNIDSLLRSGDAATILKGNVDANVQKGNALYRIHTVPLEVTQPDGTVIRARAEYNPADTYRDPGAADTKATPNDLIAEWAGKSGTTSHAKANKGDIVDTDIADYDTGSAAIKTAFNAGDKDTLLNMYDQLMEIQKTTKKGESGYESDDSVRLLFQDVEDALLKLEDTRSRQADMESFYRDNPDASVIDYAKTKR